jgi:hypothetical protein
MFQLSDFFDYGPKGAVKALHRNSVAAFQNSLLACIKACGDFSLSPIHRR